MTKEKSVLDSATDNLVKRVLELKPKPHVEMKIGRKTDAEKKREPKARAASSKPRDV